MSRLAALVPWRGTKLPSSTQGEGSTNNRRIKIDASCLDFYPLPCLAWRMAVCTYFSTPLLIAPPRPLSLT
eukprot:3228706-Prymnesium_polylepis.1